MLHIAHFLIHAGQTEYKRASSDCIDEQDYLCTRTGSRVTRAACASLTPFLFEGEVKRCQRDAQACCAARWLLELKVPHPAPAQQMQFEQSGGFRVLQGKIDQALSLQLACATKQNVSL